MLSTAMKTMIPLQRILFGVLLFALGVGATLAIQHFTPSEEKTEKDSPETTEYIYVDYMGIIHTDRKCSRLNYKGMRSERYKLSDISATYDQSFCPKCVSDKEYEAIKYK